ncbi:RDD family protein [Glaciecola sp. KUL10]|uniref:RDD family protein n=1 Tax=Glaciecola sp. (strain KUL10) TaxID=2161813 RepID=UPI000D98CD04|nr:RDD family protein [Glaciecola sp. KUL10]GBL05917.1 hypothetical protein KUL10_32500 [Glaciecola sp. KUL10]
MTVFEESKQDEANGKVKSESALNGTETRKIVTPYAFTVSNTLLGRPLASPKRRALAILIDFVLIALISTTSALLFAAFVSIIFFRAGRHSQQNGVGKAFLVMLRGLGALMLFLVVYAFISGYNDEADNLLLDGKFSETTIVDTAHSFSIQQCEGELECVETLLASHFEYYSGSELDTGEKIKALDKLLAKSQLAEAQISELRDKYSVLYESGVVEKSESNSTEQVLIDTAQADEIRSEALDEMQKAITEAGYAETKHDENKSQSIFEFFTELITDFGLGLGWAALYFSVLTAWFNGQTIGKRLLGIQVVRLDGRVPNLWESFGRYGGYGAGLATGLSGFLQLYWDPNRQAIQDKISETLVLRLK